MLQPRAAVPVWCNVNQGVEQKQTRTTCTIWDMEARIAEGHEIVLDSMSA